MMMSQDNLLEIAYKIVKMSPADETAVRVEFFDRSLTRFANNIIHQNVIEETIKVNIQVGIGKRVARISTNKLNKRALKSAVDEAIQLAKLQKELPDLPELPAGRQIFQPVRRYDPEIANATPKLRAKIIAEAIRKAKKATLNSAGMMETAQYAVAHVNSKGLSAYHSETYASFSITVATDYSSGWRQMFSTYLYNIDTEQITERAIKDAMDTQTKKELPPGRYTVILEPAALADILLFFMLACNGLSVLERRSYFTDKLGKKLFSDNITIEDNVYHPLQFGAPFDGEGLPRQRILIIDRGVVKNLVYDRLTAKRMGVEPTGHGFMLPNTEGAYPLNLVFYGGWQSQEKLISETANGILVTHLWYIRYLDPVQLLITGMTRDATFLIEDGKLKHGVANMRFNISIPEVLNNIEAMGVETVGSGTEASLMVVPPVRVKDFNFVSATTY